jgi:short-subunit dehydrogenase
VRTSPCFSGVPAEIVAATRLSELYRTAFVTGASTGLGRAFAGMLLDEGVHVWGTSRNPARLEGLGTDSDAPFTPVALDLSLPSATERTFRTAEAAAGGFDLLVNNAGFGLFAEFAAADFAASLEQLQVMLLEPARLCHLALPGMTARGHGALVNISSLAAEFPLPYQAAYNMAKAGLTALSESLLMECAGTGVVVLDVRPGDYRTGLEDAVRRPQAAPSPRMRRAWDTFSRLMRGGPPPAHAAAALRQALLRGRPGTLRTGSWFQAVGGPFLARFGSLPLRRRIQARYLGAD